MDGSALEINGGNILASNARIHAEMLSTIAATLPEAERRHAAMLREDAATPGSPPRAG